MSPDPVPQDRCAHPSFDREKVDRLRAGLPAPGAIEPATALLGALGHPTRLRIVHALGRTEELCVCDVAHLVGGSVSNASHHLRRLREAGVVTFRNDGRMAYYSLCDPRAAGLAEAALAEGEAAPVDREAPLVRDAAVAEPGAALR